MKTHRISTLALAVALFCLSSFLSLFPVRAEAGASLSGPTDVRAGDTVKLIFRISGDNLLGITCKLAYNKNQMMLETLEPLIADPWIVESNPNETAEPGAQSIENVIVYYMKQTAPINALTDLFSATFQVKGTVDPGTEIGVSVKDIRVSDGNKEQLLPSASWSATIGQPRSSDASISHLSVANATLSPAFSPTTTRYSATVPYSVRSLDFSISLTHSAASYKISGNTLAVGENSISIKVTAEDGSSRTYRIAVTREQDPSYVPSSDATLKELTVSAGTLSPAFAPDVREYVLYLPNEIDSLTLRGKTKDSKGSSPTLNAALAQGLNTLFFRGIAEDGSELVYTVHAVRMPPYAPPSGPVLPPAQTEPQDTEPLDSSPSETNPKETEPQDTEPHMTEPETGNPDISDTAKSTEPGEKENGLAQTSILYILAAGILGVVVGFGSAILWKRQSDDGEY